MEEVWLPGDLDPVILPRTSEALYLLQRVRDEAHRFAITYHRQKRSTGMLVSMLDDVPGLGESRRKALMKQFGSLKRLRAASTEELMAVPGIGRRTAEVVQAAIAEPGEPGAAAARTTASGTEVSGTAGSGTAGSGTAASETAASGTGASGAEGERARVTESTTAPQGPAERGRRRTGTGDTAEVGLVAS